jgi:hypothetical protein
LPGQLRLAFFLAEVQRSDEAQGRGIIAAREPDGRTRFEGKLRRNGLAAIARGALEHEGVQIADPYWVVYNYDEQSMGLALLISGLGLSLGLALIITGVRDSRSVRRPG